MRYVLTILCALSFAVPSGCAPETEGDEDLEIQGGDQALTAGVPVRLLWAKTDSRCVQYERGSCLNNLAQAVLSGYVEVDKLAADKQVAVRYQSQNGDWVETLASYAGPTDSDSEAWYFKTEAKTYTDRLGTDFPFAIRYTTQGQTYWDNNGGANYRVGGGPRTFFPNLVLETSVVTATELRWGLDRVDAQIALKNLGFQKDVAAVYSTDGWRTVQRAQASYQYTPSDYELWSIAMPVGVGATKIEAAFSYTVHGRTIWDNNFGRNYTLSKSAP